MCVQFLYVFYLQSMPSPNGMIENLNLNERKRGSRRERNERETGIEKGERLGERGRERESRETGKERKRETEREREMRETGRYIERERERRGGGGGLKQSLY